MCGFIMNKLRKPSYIIRYSSYAAQPSQQGYAQGTQVNIILNYFLFSMLFVKIITKQELLMQPGCVYSVTSFLPFVGGYNATPATPQSYSQPVQGYGASSYDSTTAAASSTSNSQTSYAGQASYSAQSAYPGYGQQPASATPPRYWAYSVLRSPLKIGNVVTEQPSQRYQGQQGSYGQQSSYSQQGGYQQTPSQQQQAPPTSYAPPSGSYGQPPASQYGQQGSTGGGYGQSDYKPPNQYGKSGSNRSQELKEAIQG
uniref:EWS RNA-binding protein 1b n=1 Tax=Sinocyclocheilus anshuiensis TaxID=1608454 RepID=A0A671RSA9_9TELE